jgi:DNA-binding transcriptional ArsR family regulator
MLDDLFVGAYNPAMRPLFHPAAADITVEGILHALADPVRVQIFADIAKAECPRACSAFLDVSERSVPKSTLSQHFKVLREAGLIRSERHGVELRNTSRNADLCDRFGKLIGAIIEAHTAQSKREARLVKSKRKTRTTT